MKKLRIYLALALTLCLAFLLPFPSQAATVSSQASVLEVDMVNAPYKAEQEIPIHLWLRDASATFLEDANQRVYVWAEDERGNRTDALAGSGSNSVLSLDVTKGHLEETITFLRGGEFKLYASLDNPVLGNPVRFITDLKGSDVLQIGEKRVLPGSIRLFYQGKSISDLVDGEMVDFPLEMAPGLPGVTVTARVYDKQDRPVGQGMLVEASTNSAGIRVSPTSATTDINGEVTFKVYGDMAGDFKLYLEAGGHANTVPVQVQPERVVMHIASYTMEVDNKKLSLDAAPIIRTNRTYVPYRALGEAFGAKVEWFPASQSVYVSQSDKLVTMTNQSTRYTVNGMAKTMDAAPFIQNSRMMVPVRFVAENLGYRVNVTYNQDGTTKDIIFTK